MNEARVEQAASIGTISEVVPTPLEDQAIASGNALVADIERVRQNGDVFDSISSLRWGVIARRGALPVGSAAEVYAGSGSLVTGTVAGALAIGSVVAYSLYKGRKERPLLGEQLRASRAESGQSYELYRVNGYRKNRGDVELVWYGPDDADQEDSKSVVAHLRDIAIKAKETGVTRMHVEASAYNEVLHELGIGKLEMQDLITRDLRHVVQEIKHVHISGGVSAKVHTPDWWLKITEPLLEQERRNSIATLRDSLESIRPSHPLAQIIRAYEENPSFLADKLKQHARASIERRLEETDTQSNRHITGASATEQTKVSRTSISRRTGTVVYKTHEKDGTPVLPAHQLQARWQAPGQASWLQPLHEALEVPSPEEPRPLSKDGQTPEKQNAFELLLKHPEINVSVAERALELALLRFAYSLPVKVAPQTIKENEPESREPFYPTVQLLTRLLDKGEPSFSDHRLLQVVMGGALIAGALFGTHELYKGVENRANHSISVTKDRLAREQHVTPDLIQDDDARVAAEARSDKMHAWKALQRFNKKLAIKLPFQGSDEPDSKQGSPLASSTTSGVGNTGMGDSPDVTQFTLTPHNASTAGMWATSTSSTLEIRNDIGGQLGWMSTKDDKRLFGMAWLQESHENPRLDTLPQSLPANYADKPWIKVERDVQAGDNFMGVPKGATKFEKETLIYAALNSVNVPVLYGMAPVAAQIDGKKIVLHNKKDGTFAFTNEDEHSKLEGHLTYWVSPSDQAKPWGTGKPLKIVGSDSSAPNAVETRTIIEQAIRKADPSLPLQPGQKDYAIALEKQIQDKWNYTYDPFEKNEQQTWDSLSDFATVALKNKLANCNVANTLEEIIDPSAQAIFGYNNNAQSGNNLLTSHELHMKRTDGDATPYLTPATPNTPENGRNIAPQNLLVGAALMMSVLAAVRYRRRIASVAKTSFSYVNGRHERKLLGYSPREVFSAQAVIEHSLYARPGSAAPTAEAVEQRAASLVAQERPAQSLLLRPDIYSKTSEAVVTQAAQNYSAQHPQLATMLKSGKRGLRLARRAAKHQA